MFEDDQIDYLHQMLFLSYIGFNYTDIKVLIVDKFP